MISLYLQAPFAACRSFTAGWYRPTATFVTPSAVYGLILNVAGIDSRLREEDEGHDGRTPATLVRPGLPAMRIAIGVPEREGGDSPHPLVQTMYQQLHNYPVGKDAGMPQELSRGNKNNITPVRREFLADVRAIIAVDGGDDLETRIQRGLRGELNDHRYGLPFLGDNQFLLDRLDLRDPNDVPAVYWYCPLDEDSKGGQRPGTTRMTVWIDRADMSKTVSHLYAPTEEASAEIPEDAWTTIEPKNSGK